MDLYRATWIISGVFALSATLSTLHLIYHHLRHYTEPRLQRYIVRILWMIPIYAIDSFLSLRYYDSALYFDVWRDCYEAYVLYCFFSLLIAYLDGIEVLEEVLETKPPTAHPFPLCFLPTFKPGREFLLWCRRFVLQFVLVKPILSGIALFLEILDLYGDGELQFNRGYIYVALINNVSITLSLYYLVLFYIVTEENLKPFNPLPKFMCIKAIIFFSWWQGIIIVGLVYFQLIVDVGVFTAGNIALFLQNFLICFEMFCLAIIHRFVFHYEQFKKPNSFSRDINATMPIPDQIEFELDEFNTPLHDVHPVPPGKFHKTVLQNLQDVADVSDVLGEARDVFKNPSNPHKHAKNI